MSNDEYYGRAIIDGIPQFYSVSSLERGDIRSGGCQLKWHKRYVQGLKDKPSASKTAGNALHSEFQTYYQADPTAPIMLSAMAMRALPYLPERGPDILSEVKLSSPKAPFLYADGVPLIVKVDLIHDRCTNKGSDDVEELQDPPGTIEIIDFKWKKDASARSQGFHLQPPELVKSIQMAGYGVAVGNVWPSTEHVRLSHVYVPATGLPRKVTRLHVIDQCRETWEYVESVARSLRDIAKEKDERNVPGNRHACDKYGGCDHRYTCYAYARNVEQYTTSLLFGQTAAAELKEATMGLLSTLPPNLQPQNAAVAASTNDVHQQLAQEESQLRMQAAQTAAGSYPGFAEAWQTIERLGNVQGGQGMPSLAGQAAQLKAAMGGYQITPGAGLAGAGPLGAISIADPAHVIALAKELAGTQSVQQPAPIQYATAPVQQPQFLQQPAPVVQHVQHIQQPTSILPPDAPVSNPALAAKSIDGFSMPGQAVAAPITAAVTMQLPAQPAVLEAPAPKKRGRRSKAEIEAANAAAGVAPVTTGQPIVMQQAHEIVRGPMDTTGFNADSMVFVDAIPNSEYESLHPYVDALCKQLNAKFNNAPGALQDIRCAPKDSLLGFGAAPGALRALALECPPPAGYYYLSSADPLAAEVGHAMRTLCERTGALYVKGVK